MKRIFLTGILVLVPAWGTFLILRALFVTLDHLWVDLFGPKAAVAIPGVGIALFVLLILLTGMMATHFLGQRLIKRTEESFERIPLVRSVYNTFKGMTDVFHYREHFGHSMVVVFPFPREGLWALGFLMGVAPAPLQVSPVAKLMMVFVPTAIHPFTGYLAFVPQQNVQRIRLRPQEAMKMEFSAGLYRPPKGWLGPQLPVVRQTQPSQSRRQG